MKKNNFLFLIAGMLGMLLFACKRQDVSDVTISKPTVHFTNTASGSFFIQNVPNASFKIPIGITSPRDKETRVMVSVTSPTGAALGAQYNLPSTTITIPAGKVIDSLSVEGLFAGYAGSRRDTLVFTITSADVDIADYNRTYRLVLQKYCNVTLSAFTGAYIAQDFDGTTGVPSGGPYTVTLTPGTAAGSAGTVTVTGLLGITTPFTLSLDWNNPANFSTNVVDQNWFVHATYGQARIRANGSGTFSSCDNTLTIRSEPYVSAGSFGKFTTTLRK